MKRLIGSDVLGKKIVCVYEKKTEKIDRFQNRMTFVQLDNGAVFSLDAIRYPKKDLPVEIWGCEYEKSFVPVLSIEKSADLNSAIKAIVYADDFAIDTAILLENDFILTVSIGEFDMGHSFYKPSKEFRNYNSLEIAS